jgi:hypothetical protein
MGGATGDDSKGSDGVAPSSASRVSVIPDERVDEMFQEYERAFATELEEHKTNAQIRKAAKKIDALIVSVTSQEYMRTYLRTETWRDSR